MFRTPRSLVALAMVLAAPLGAQQKAAAAAAAPPACDIEQMQPQQLAMAAIGRSKVVGAKSADDGIKGIRDGLKNVFDKATAQNQLGRDYLAAQYLVMAIEFGGEVQTRGNLSLPGDKNQQVDLVVMADSLLTMVEAAKPACKEETVQWREYKPFANRVRAAYDALQKNNLDSAEKSAARALILSKAAPQPYDIMWRVKQAKGDEDGTISFLNQAVDKLAGDTANARVRGNLLFNLGRMQQQFAEKAPEPRKTQLYKGASETYVRVIREYPGGEEAPFAINGVNIGWAMTKDSTQAIQALGACKAGSAKLGDIGLAQCGVIATRLNKGADAAELFKGATTVNPYSRDYLYNYAATLFDLKRSQDMIPVVSRLLALDPSNPDNVMLFAYAYKGLADSTKDAAMKKAYSDSAVAYSTKSDAMKVKMVYTGFDRGKDATTLQGEVENRDPRGPKSWNIEFEFLDKAGAVIEKKAVAVGPVAPNQSGAFSVELGKGGVSGVRYAPLAYDPTPVPVAEPEKAPEPPMTVTDVSTLLSVKAPQAKIVEMAGKRGCKITWNAAATAAMKKAGGTDAAIAAIKSACGPAKP